MAYTHTPSIGIPLTGRTSHMDALLWVVVRHLMLHGCLHIMAWEMAVVQSSALMPGPQRLPGILLHGAQTRGPRPLPWSNSRPLLWSNARPLLWSNVRPLPLPLPWPNSRPLPLPLPLPIPRRRSQCFLSNQVYQTQHEGPFPALTLKKRYAAGYFWIKSSMR